MSGATPSQATQCSRIRLALLLALVLAGLSVCLAVATASHWFPNVLAGGIVYAPNHDRPPDPADDLRPAEWRRLGVSRQARIRVGDPPAALSIWIIEPPAAAGGAPPTVFVLHGIRDRKDHLLGLGRALAADGHRVVLVDLRGHGRSEGDWLSYGVRESADLARLLDELTARGWVSGPAGVMGPSYGAAAAIQWAGRDPRLAAVVAVAPFTSLRDVVRDYIRHYLPGLGGLIPNRLVDEGLARAGRLANFEPAEADPLRAIRSARAPVLFIHGRDDRNIPCAHSIRLHAAAPPGSQLLLLDGEDHFSITRSGTDATRQVIRDWFRRWLNASTASGLTCSQ
ncbi:MAG: alpha/beta hydrolase [Acidobacteria bacterium]|nr:alpha/beta hydrolase [Acidobacteriota bacterium]